MERSGSGEEVINLRLHTLQIDDDRLAGCRVDVHLLLEGGLGLPGAGVHGKDTAVPGDTTDMDMPGMEDLGDGIN